MKSLPPLVLKPEREKSLRNRHPWLFSGALAAQRGPQEPGYVTIQSSSGEPLAAGFYNPSSELRVRLLAFGDELTTPWRELVTARLRAAVALRRKALPLLPQTNAFRLINGEGDDLSGLIVDNYDGHLVVEVLARWVLCELDFVLLALGEAFSALGQVKSVRLRIEDDAQRQEGFTEAELAPLAKRQEGAKRCEILELGLRYAVDLEEGQKTGFFLDQRDSRHLCRHLAQGRDVLNLFSYTGGFSLNALQGGATSVTSVDRSAKALELLAQNITLNGLSGPSTIVCEDIKRYLPQAEQDTKRYGLVICDPPPLARKRAHIEQAARAYKDFNRRAMKLINQGDLLTFSCSPYIDRKLFSQIVFSAAREAQVRARVLRHLGPGQDHPVSLYLPEGEYLQGLWIAVG